MKDDPESGGAGGKFPATRWSAVVAARSNDPAERKRALEAIIAAYWKPLYKYIRIRWAKNKEDAQDLAQQFFLRVIEKNDLEDFDPQKARLRTFLRGCADHFVANEMKAANRQKRGGGALHIPLDFAAAETELARAKPLLGAGTSAESMDDFIEKEFMRSLFAMALANLRQLCETSGKSTHFRLFEIYVVTDLEEGEKRPSYSSLAGRFGISETDVTNFLAQTRREFRRILLERLREMTVSEEEFRSEARRLLGVEAE